MRSSLSLALFHKISFKERLIFCRICEFGCDGVVLEAPRRPGAGEAKGTDVTMGFLAAPPEAEEPGSFLEVDVVAPGTSPVCLVAGTLPEGAGEGHGLLGIVPLKPEGNFLMAGLGTFVKGGDFFGRRLRAAGCLLPTAGPGAATFFGIAAAVFSTCRSSFMAAKNTSYP